MYTYTTAFPLDKTILHLLILFPIHVQLVGRIQIAGVKEYTRKKISTTSRVLVPAVHPLPSFRPTSSRKAATKSATYVHMYKSSVGDLLEIYRRSICIGARLAHEKKQNQANVR